MSELVTYGVAPHPPHEEPVIAGIILAAGASRSLGSVKALLELNGRTFVEHVIDMFQAVGIDPIYVVLGHHREQVRARLPAGVRTAVCARPDDGEIHVVQAGLNALGGFGHAVLIGTADQPVVAPETMQALIETYRSQRPGAVVPSYHGTRGFPVLVARGLYPDFYRTPGDEYLRAALEPHAADVLEVPVEDERILIKVNNDADLRRLVELYGPEKEEKHAGDGFAGYEPAGESPPSG